MRLTDLPTPCALIERSTVVRNVERASRRALELGVRLRPHVKTHKCVEAARLQIAGVAGVAGPFSGITVSTLAEAWHFARAGFSDLTYAFPIPVDRIPEAVELARRVDHLHLVVDHPEAAARLEEAAARGGVTLDVWLEIDCGDHRAGVDPAGAGAVQVARRLAAAEGIRFRGLLTHGGQSYGACSPDEIADAAREERDVTVACATRLRADGVDVPEVSIGSTPTFGVLDSLAGVTEVRPGNYVFFDAYQVAIGSCSRADVAFSVLATVVGVHPESRTLIVNAGALALSKDAGPTHVDPDCGYGVVLSLDGKGVHRDLRVDRLSQEHGRIRSLAPLDPSRFPLGSRLRIIPNHSCLAAALHDRYHVLDGDRVVEIWRPVRGW